MYVLVSSKTKEDQEDIATAVVGENQMFLKEKTEIPEDLEENY